MRSRDPYSAIFILCFLLFVSWSLRVIFLVLKYLFRWMQVARIDTNLVAIAKSGLAEFQGYAWPAKDVYVKAPLSRQQVLGYIIRISKKNIFPGFREWFVTSEQPFFFIDKSGSALVGLNHKISCFMKPTTVRRWQDLPADVKASLMENLNEEKIGFQPSLKWTPPRFWKITRSTWDLVFEEYEINQGMPLLLYGYFKQGDGAFAQYQIQSGFENLSVLKNNALYSQNHFEKSNGILLSAFSNVLFVADRHQQSLVKDLKDSILLNVGKGAGLIILLLVVIFLIRK